MIKETYEAVNWRITASELGELQHARYTQQYKGSRTYVKRGPRSVEAINGKWFGAYRNRYICISESLPVVLAALVEPKKKWQEMEGIIEVKK